MLFADTPKAIQMLNKHDRHHRHHGHRHPYPSLPRPPPLTRSSLSTTFHLLSRGRDWNPELATNGGSIIKIGGSERGAFHLKEHVTFFAHCMSPDLERSIEVMRSFLYSEAKRNGLVSSDMRALLDPRGLRSYLRDAQNGIKCFSIHKKSLI